MTRVSLLASPLLLGFDGIEHALDRLSKSQVDGYPPYNIERFTEADGASGAFRITLAVAGFSVEQLEICQEANQLTIKGKQAEDKTRTFLHRGIAARQFQRVFVLADGVEVVSAELESGLLVINLVRPEPTQFVRRIEIVQKG